MSESGEVKVTIEVDGKAVLYTFPKAATVSVEHEVPDRLDDLLSPAVRVRPSSPWIDWTLRIRALPTVANFAYTAFEVC